MKKAAVELSASRHTWLFFCSGIVLDRESAMKRSLRPRRGCFAHFCIKDCHSDSCDSQAEKPFWTRNLYFTANNKIKRLSFITLHLHNYFSIISFRCIVSPAPAIPPRSSIDVHACIPSVAVSAFICRRCSSPYAHDTHPTSPAQ